MNEASKGCYNIFATIVNFFVAMGWLWVFQSLGWISFSLDKPLWQNLVLAALLAWLVMTILGIVYTFFILATCLIGCVTLPIYYFAVGYLVLLGVEKITHIFTFNPSNDFWIFLLMSIAFGIVKLPYLSTSSSSSSSSS